MIGLSIRTLQRWRKGLIDQRCGPKNHARRLSLVEREKVVSISCSEDYFDLAPALIVAKLADQGKYVASESTFYRLLRKQCLLKHRSRAKKPIHRAKVETVALRPNQVWCWDITNLRSRTSGFFYKLYLFEDLYSRKIVGWDVLESEFDGDAVPIFNQALINERINGVGLRVHADNGNPMRGSNMVTTLLSLGVRPSFSRPSVSNDNAYIESLFKTMKYTPMYPTKPFASLKHAKQWVSEFTDWYNNHMHSRLSYVTPNQRHKGEDEAILEKRRLVYNEARNKNPHRWSSSSRSWPQPKLAKLNPYGTRMVS